MKPKSILAKRLASFGYALCGIGTLFRTQFHAWLHLLATLAVVGAGFLFSVTYTEWCLLILAVGLVWSAEAINTAIEFVVDLVSPDHHELARDAKDVAAGAVLLASIAAALMGLIIFGPKFYALISG